MEIFICKICGKKSNNINGLRSHNIQKHNVSAEDTYIAYVLDGITPKCQCGCGESPSFISITKGFYIFIQSHHNRVPGKNNYQKNPETHQKAIETQKKNWKEGKYKGWWENDNEETRQKIEGIKKKLRNNKERGRKISKSLTGIPKTEESKVNISNTQKIRYKNDPTLIQNLSENRIKWLKRRGEKKKTKLEKKFENILKSLKIKNNFQYEFEHKFYDFYVNEKNILIEVDGDFYHCNPNSSYNIPKYKVQFLTIRNDEIKNKDCRNKNIKLLRYWEKDINERPEWIISELKREIL
jgi:very-short-patch-repair endonuclease